MWDGHPNPKRVLIIFSFGLGYIMADDLVLLDAVVSLVEVLLPSPGHHGHHGHTMARLRLGICPGQRVVEWSVWEPR